MIQVHNTVLQFKNLNTSISKIETCDLGLFALQISFNAGKSVRMHFYAKEIDTSNKG